MRFIIFLLCLLPSAALANVYVQYDASTADANNHVYFSSVSKAGTANPPQPPSNITQLVFPDGTNINNMMLDLSQSPPALIPIPPSPIAAGIVITSTGNSDLDGTYAIDASAQANINAVATYILLNGAFPGGGTTMPWYDAGGTVHTMPSVTEFKVFATAIADYVAALTLAVASNSTLPSNQITIP